MNRLPGFFIVGAAKSGTTTLYHWLDQHPEVYMSPIKEPNHFCTDIRPADFSKEFRRYEREKNLDLARYLEGPMKKKHWGCFVEKRSDYEKLFKNRKAEKAAGESSNSYLYSKEAAANIRRDIPGARIVIMLRNPAERAYSHYLANQRDGRTFLPFLNELSRDQESENKGWGRSYLYLEMGLYYEQVKRYLDIFPREQVKIFLYDDFVKNPAAVMQEICRFIGVSDQVPVDVSEKHNRAREPLNSRLLYILSQTGLKKKVFHFVPPPFRKGVKALFYSNGKILPLKKEDREYLNLQYREDILKLEKLINRDLSGWLK